MREDATSLTTFDALTLSEGLYRTGLIERSLITSPGVDRYLEDDMATPSSCFSRLWYATPTRARDITRTPRPTSDKFEQKLIDLDTSLISDAYALLSSVDAAFDPVFSPARDIMALSPRPSIISTTSKLKIIRFPSPYHKSRSRHLCGLVRSRLPRAYKVSVPSLLSPPSHAAPPPNFCG